MQEATASSLMSPRCCRQCRGQFQRRPARTTIVPDFVRLGFTAATPLPDQGCAARADAGCCSPGAWIESARAQRNGRWCRPLATLLVAPDLNAKPSKQTSKSRASDAVKAVLGAPDTRKPPGHSCTWRLHRAIRLTRVDRVSGQSWDPLRSTGGPTCGSLSLEK